VRAAVGSSRPLAIALTGYGQQEDQARGLEAGFDHYLVKPVGLEALLPLIGSSIGRGARADADTAPQV
jgi:DNA-binding response OmpR family regulator